MSLILGNETSRPRDVDAKRAAAILYGDWGTSKAYVIGLAFAVAGYSSFWLLLAMCGITGLVALNYVLICKHYPNGGGVYASVRHRSEVISIVGAFLLIADYIVTAALSALSAFTYLRFPHPEIFAALAIAGIGALNLLGPKHTGGLAVAVSVPTFVVVTILAIFCVPHLGFAVHNVQPLSGGFFKNWNGLVAIVLALSGVEAIANATGVMKLDPGSTPEQPSVMKTAKPALLWIALEVCFLTAFLGLGMHALGGLHTVPGDSSGIEVGAPGAPPPGVRDYMLRYMGQIFVGGVFGPHVGEIFAWAVAIVFGLLLLSAVNTAIGGLITVQFLMARDGEMPPVFKQLNSYGVPKIGTIVATLIPAALVLLVSDVSGLADLYAVGVVGAIACNLGATSTDRKVPLKTNARAMMFVTFLLMAAIEISLFVDKPNARIFATVILVVGLIMRELAKERAARKRAREASVAAGQSPAAGSTVGLGAPGATAARSLATTSADTEGEPMLVAVRGKGRTLDFALKEAQQTRRPLYLLFVREQTVITSEDRKRKWASDQEAGDIFAYAKSQMDGKATVLPCYAVSDSAADTIVDVAATVGASRLILGSPNRNSLLNLLRGNIVREVSGLLPEDIDLLVYA